MIRLALLRSIPASALAIIMAPCAAAEVSADSAGDIVCAISTTPLIFGEYVPIDGAPADFTSSIIVTCTTSSVSAKHWKGTISLNGAGTASSRQLRQGYQTLEYRLYQDPSRTRIWGDRGSGTERSISGTVSATFPYRQALIVYGRIPARQTLATVNRYSDNIVAILQYDQGLVPLP